MDKNNRTVFQFMSEPTDINFGGKVHGGVVMKWIDQTAYACARNWSELYCVTVYVGGIRFYKPINIGEVIKVVATVIYTGKTSIHIAVDVFSKNFTNTDFDKKTHCVIVFVSVGSDGHPVEVKKWAPVTQTEKKLEEYALRLKALRESIDIEMEQFLRH